MFTILKPSRKIIEAFLTNARHLDISYAEAGATSGRIPDGYTIDHNRVKLGSGSQTFRKAVAAVRSWKMFDLGWVQLFPPHTSITAGETVAVLIRHLGFWSLNACRIVYVIDEQHRFGFAYGTLLEHAEQGEERFSVEWEREGDSVFYDILAFSKPRQWQARVARPVSRMLQKRFARDSLLAMKHAVDERDQRPERVYT